MRRTWLRRRIRRGGARTHAWSGVAIRACKHAPYAVLVLLLLAGCGPKEKPPVKPLVLVASGDTSGWIVPCGCASNQSGGMPRRGSYVAQVGKEVGDVLLVDAGGAAAGTSTYDRLKFEAILEGEVAMAVAAHNVGAAELAFGLDYLEDVQTRLDVPLISASIVAADGKSPFEPMRVVEKAGRRVAIIGVVDPQYAPDGMTLRNPREAVLSALSGAELSGSDEKYDAVVVLAYLDDDALRALAQSLPEVDVVIGGPTGQPIQPERIGPALLTSATNKGKFLVRLDAPEDDDAWTAKVVELGGTFGDHPDQLANLKQYYDLLGRRDLSPEETSLVAPLPAGVPAGYSIAGTARCIECHKEDGRLWAESGHAHAWASLAAKGAEVDPDCQRCHTTGYGLPGGFAGIRRNADEDGRPRRIEVGCESCHGPSLAHCDDPKVHTAYYARAADRCVVCHDRENSPHFEYDRYWRLIEHGVASEGERVAD